MCCIRHISKLRLFVRSPGSGFELIRFPIAAGGTLWSVAKPAGTSILRRTTRCERVRPDCSTLGMSAVGW